MTLADIALDDAAYVAARAAFEEHSVLVFRGQGVTDELQLAFSRRFGPPDAPFQSNFGGPHPRVCLFLLADNSVRPFADETSEKVLGQLARRGK